MWFRVDDKLHSHPKRYRTNLRAMGLWVLAGSWSSDQLTDGFIPRELLATFGAEPADADSLVSAELWHEVAGGWQFNDWLAMNPSRAEVRQRRDATAARQQRWREKARRDRESGQFAPGLRVVDDGM